MEALKDGGVYVVWIETVSSKEEIDAPLPAAEQVGLNATCTLSFDTNDHTMMGLTPSYPAGLADDHQCSPVACSGNCHIGTSDLLVSLLSLADASLQEDVIIARANAGISVHVHGEIRYIGKLQIMDDCAVLARYPGARIISGCCGRGQNMCRPCGRHC